MPKTLYLLETNQLVCVCEVLHCIDDDCLLPVVRGLTQTTQLAVACQAPAFGWAHQAIHTTGFLNIVDGTVRPAYPSRPRRVHALGTDYCSY